MGDVFIERMIKKRMEAKDWLLCLGIVAAAAAVILLGFVVGIAVSFPMISLLITAGACFGGFKLLSMQFLEFEYSLTNGFVAVDKIMNRASRKRMTSFECSTAEDIGEYPKNAPRLKNQSFDTRIFASEYADGRNSWYMVVRSPKTGKTLVVFDPDEALLEGIQKFIPRQLKFEKFGRVTPAGQVAGRPGDPGGTSRGTAG